jgi:hypothetical protein
MYLVMLVSCDELEGTSANSGLFSHTGGLDYLSRSTVASYSTTVCFRSFQAVV